MRHLPTEPDAPRLEVREHLVRRRGHFARRRADDDEQLRGIGRGHDADDMEIAEAIVATVAESETQRIGNLTAELEIFAIEVRGWEWIGVGSGKAGPG